MQHAKFGIVSSILVTVLTIVLLSTNSSFAYLIEEINQDRYGKLCYIGTQNSDCDTLNYTNRGDELFDEGKYEEAITYFDKALAVNPDDSYALNNKGIALKNLGKYEEAITYYEKILHKSPNDFDALYNKGTSLYGLGKYEEAINYFDKALAVNSTDTDTLYYKGIALKNLGKYEEAITYFDKALAVKPYDSDILNWKGYSLYNLGKFDEAITYFDKVLEIDSKNDYARNLRTLSSTHSPHYIDSNFLTSTSIVADKDASNTTQSKPNTFRDSKTKVPFQYQSDWEVASDEYIESAYGDSEGLVVLMIPKSLDGASISVIYEKLPFSMTAKEYVNIIKKSLLKEKDTSVSKAIPISIGSLNGYKYNVTIAGQALPDGEFVNTQIVFVKNSKAFAITYSHDAEMAQDLEAIESIIKSFEINNSNKDNDNTKNDNKTENDDTRSLSNDEEFENAKEKGKGILSNIFKSLFPQTGEKFGNSVYGVDIAFPKNWSGFEMKIIFPMAMVSPEGFNITGIFSKYSDSMVDNLAKTILSNDGKELSEEEVRELFEPKVQESAEELTGDLMKYMEDKTYRMGIFIYDKEFARLVNSIDPNNTKSVDSLASIYERLAASDPTINCERKTLEYITLNNISAEMSTELCSYTDGNKNENNVNYFILSPNAIVGVQYASDSDKENKKFRAEFDQALKSLSVEESLPINNQTIQQFLTG